MSDNEQESDDYEDDTDDDDDDSDDDDSDDDNDFEIENLAVIERVFDDDFYLQNTDTKWFIGLYFKQYDYNLYAIHVSPSSYFNYSHDVVKRYLRRYSCMELPKDAKIEIMEMVVETFSLNGYEFPIKKVILKTHWIRLIQRCWRNVLKHRHNTILKRGLIRNLRHAELTGRNLPEYSVLPGLCGCIKNKH